MEVEPTELGFDLYWISLQQRCEVLELILNPWLKLRQFICRHLLALSFQLRLESLNGGFAFADGFQ